MKIPRRNSFIVGFATALCLFAAVFAWRNWQWWGGTYADSPDGSYQIMIWAPLSPQRGGAYSIELIDKSTSTNIRELTLSVPATESTETVREGGGSILWNDESTYADIKIGGAEVLRLWVP